MTPGVLTLDPELNIRDAMDVLSSHHVSGAPVVSGERVVGVVSATDLLAFAAALPGVPMERSGPRDWESIADEVPTLDDDEPQAAYFMDMWEDAGADTTSRFSAPEGPEWNMLEEHTVSEAMTRAPVCSLPPAATVTEAAEYMQRASIHRVLVIENERIVGIVTSSDVARAAAEDKLGKRVYMFPRPVSRGRHEW
jgi:CBS domain-containing protein